jgi:hypothetical protein
MKKAETLVEEGFSLKYIAELLNDECVPAVIEKDKWRAEDISRLLDKLHKRDFAGSLRNSQPRNGQGLE